MPKLVYFRLDTVGSYCPDCHQPVTLLSADTWPTRNTVPVFYICWTDKAIFQAGVGRVQEDT